MSKQPPRLPDIDSEGYWYTELADTNFRLREATLSELKDAHNKALQESPQDPTIDEQAFLLATVCQRKKKDGAWEEVTYSELMAKGVTFSSELATEYALGLLVKRQRLKKSVKPSNAATSQTQP